MTPRLCYLYQLYCKGTNTILTKFFGLQADGSTDCANVENELFTVHYPDPRSNDGKVNVHNRNFAVRQPLKLMVSNAMGLFKCLEAAMNFVGISESE